MELQFMDLCDLIYGTFTIFHDFLRSRIEQFPKYLQYIIRNNELISMFCSVAKRVMCVADKSFALQHSMRGIICKYELHIL